jgi:DNA-binding MarR family transcriptional regulator
VNETIHQTSGYASWLHWHACPPRIAEFTYLRDLLEVTDGNLGAHLRKLEEAGYINLNKAFVERKPRTYISATADGRKVFSEHVAALEAILKSK